MIKCIKFNFEKKYIKDFLKLPQLIYTHDNNTETKEDVKKLLLEKHILSKYFKINKYLVYDDKKVVGRFIITTYENDMNCYIGLFEVYKNNKYAKIIFDKAKEFANENGYKKIIGPLYASFWIKYRLKINMFEENPYTGEPYNREYYLKFFEENGFKECNRYISNKYDEIEYNYENKRCNERYKEFIKKGYEIKRIRKEEYEIIIEQLYDILTSLYKDFPMYKHIEKVDFIKLFKNYKYILNFNMVKFAYYKGEMVGFFINFPNYENKVYNLKSFKNFIDVLKTKRNTKEYIMMYMGVNPKHKGLGNVLTYKVLQEIKGKKITSIGALIKKGKVTGAYLKDKIKEEYEYSLLEYKF